MTPQIPSDPPREVPVKFRNDDPESVAASDDDGLKKAGYARKTDRQYKKYKKRKPRSKNLHVGVSVLPPDRDHPYFRLRFPNPDYDPDAPKSPKLKYQALEPHQRNHTELAIAKRDELGLDRFGHPPKREKAGLIVAPLPIPDAIKIHFRENAKYDDPLHGTGRSYRKALVNHFEPWAIRRGLKTVDDITLKNLGPGQCRLANGQIETVDGLKVTVERATALKTKKGGQPGETEDTGNPLSPMSVNKELRSISAVLGWLVDRGHITTITRAELAIALERNTLQGEAPVAVPLDAVKGVLAAAQAHDAVCVETTREDPYLRKRKVRSDRKAPMRKKKVRWSAIQFLIYFIVCTGMRISEALKLTWVQFEPHTSLPGNLPGQVPGAINLHSWQTKTRKKRTVYLCVCPTIVTLLEQFRGDAEPTDRIFAALTYGRVIAARKRLLSRSGQDKTRRSRKDKLPVKRLTKGKRQVKEKADPPPSGFDSPSFDYQQLRATCATWLATLRGPNFESQQLGHGVKVAEEYYVGRVIIPHGASTLEQAMGLTKPHVMPTVRAEIKPPAKRKKEPV
jgi:integrase